MCHRYVRHNVLDGKNEFRALHGIHKSVEHVRNFPFGKGNITILCSLGLVDGVTSLFSCNGKDICTIDGVSLIHA